MRAKFPADGAGDKMDLFHRARRQQQTVFVIESISFGRTGYHLVEQRNIFGMNAFPDHLQRDFAGNLVLEDAVGFVGPKVFVSGDTPAKTAGATQLLRLG